jgi:hypothetical protein
MNVKSSRYIEIPVTQDTSCALETRLDIHEQISYYMLYGDTSNTRYVVITDLFMNVKSSI